MSTMSDLRLHFLDAREQICEHKSWIANALKSVHSTVDHIHKTGSLDVVIRADCRVIPEKGHVGHAVGPGVIFITVDPENAALQANEQESFERMFAHELHHAIRWDGPGYGNTLGEALISEGLAGHFVLEVFGGEPELWEQLALDVLAPHRAEARHDWHVPRYDHAAWFFGTGDKPRWLGYSLGFDIVGHYLKMNPEETASSLAHAKAGDFVHYLENG